MFRDHIHNSPWIARPTDVDSRMGCMCCVFNCPQGGRPCAAVYPSPHFHSRREKRSRGAVREEEEGRQEGADMGKKVRNVYTPPGAKAAPERSSS